MKKKSDSLSSLQESGDSGLGLRIVDSIYKGRLPREYSKESPTLRSGKAGDLLVYGPTKSTNMPVKSTEEGSEIKNSLKATSGKSPARKYPIMTCSALAFLVKVFPLLENVKVFKTSQGELFSLKSSESLEIKDQNTYSLRMLKDYFLTTRAEPSQLYCFHWMSLGMMRNGLSQTLSITYRKTGKGSLSSVLEKEVEEKYYLSEWALKRIDKFGMRIDNNEAGVIKARTGGPQNDERYINQGRIRRLTPRECERLQGFPDGWTEGVSDTQRYKMMGNAVSVPVIAAIGKKILEAIQDK